MHVSRSTRRGLTLIEVVVIILVIGVLIALLIPAVGWVRESARQATCVDNMKQLGTALRNYASRYRTFPPGSLVTRDADGQIAAEDGWSWTMHLLPEMENKALYDTVDIHADKPGDTSNAAVRDLLDTRIGELICPSYQGPRFADPDAKSGALSTYKGMGATHWESLSVNTDVPEVPKYLPESTWKHPDGAMYPAKAHKLEDFKGDGLSCTVLVVETIEPVAARWAVGAEATLVGLPPNVTIEPPIAFKRSYFAPTGFDGYFGEKSRVDPSFKTYLDWDYEDSADGPYLPGKQQGTRGPGSHHPGVVNHLLVSGNVETITTEIGPALYMFFITRDGGDPVRSGAKP